MCGISGIIKQNNSYNGLESEIIKMNMSLKHRGPNNSGTWVDNHNGVALGHRRLSILDLSNAGNQPMQFQNKNLVLTFNGEIYNHLEIREKLENETHYNFKWTSHSDTETLLRAFETWGIHETLKICSGMFSIAVWNKKRKILTLARDRFGEKPLYYGWGNNDFIFASEIKAIKTYKNFNNAICKKSLAFYLRVNYVPSPLSIYKNIFKLDPGTYIEINKSTKNITQISKKKFWSLETNIKDNKLLNIHDENLVIEELEKKLIKSVKSQMLSDVPLGGFLSGGIDSSLITALMQRENNRSIKTFTIGFNDKQFDESIFAKKVSNYLGTDHSEIIISDKDSRNVIPLLPQIYDEPFADSSQIPTYLICKVAKQNVTVALSGDGGDELFGGYNRYTWSPKIWKKISILPFFLRKKLGELSLNISERNLDIILKSFINRGGYKIHKIGRALLNSTNVENFMQNMTLQWVEENNLIMDFDNNKFNNSYIFQNKINNSNLTFNDPISKMIYLDTVTYLQDDILCKLDRAAMSNSLETRLPFLDKEVVEFANKIPIHIKIKNGTGKWPLKKILSKYVPENLVDRPKTGFSIPLGKWLKGPLRDWAESLLNEKRIAQEGFFSSKLISAKWQQHLDGNQDHSSNLWSILMFQSWLENQ